VTPGRFAGLYRFLEDGWRGRLELTYDEGRRLNGRYRTDRYQKDFDVDAEIDADLPHKVRITVAEFNEMAEQLFVGYLFRTSANVITGTTYAEGTTFGFCARKTRSLVFASFRSGDVRPEDFSGLYTLHEEDRQGVLRLAVVDGDRLGGTYTELGESRAWRVTAHVDEAVRHGLGLQIEHPRGAEDRVYTGYLATRPKNLVAGSVSRAGRPLGFYMVKLSDSWADTPLPRAS
jgi:hypothetical protein